MEEELVKRIEIKKQLKGKEADQDSVDNYVRNIWEVEQDEEWKLSVGFKSISVQFSSVTQSWPTLFNSMDCSTPGLPVHHQLPELTQTHVHWVGDTIQPSHPLLSPSPPTFNLSQYQGLFKWVSSLHQVAKVLMFSFNISPSNDIQDWFPLGWTGWISLLSKDSQESSPTPHFKSINSLVLSFLSSPTLTSIDDYWKNHSLTRLTFVGKVMALLLNMLSELTHWKRPWCARRDWGQEEKGTTEDEMAGWHHRLDGHEFEWTPRVGDGQGGLACCNSWSHKELDTTEWLNWTELGWS